MGGERVRERETYGTLNDKCKGRKMVEQRTSKVDGDKWRKAE